MTQEQQDERDSRLAQMAHDAYKASYDTALLRMGSPELPIWAALVLAFKQGATFALGQSTVKEIFELACKRCRDGQHVRKLAASDWRHYETMGDGETRYVGPCRAGRLRDMLPAFIEKLVTHV